MKAYAVSFGTFKMKVQTGRTVRIRAEDIRVRLDEMTLYKLIATVEKAAFAVLVKLSAKYDCYMAEKMKLELSQYPPHTLLCDDDCDCHPKLFQTYLRKKGTK